MRAIVLGVFLLWVNTFYTNAFAQDSRGSDLRELQGLTYLQGYDLPPPSKNVTVYDKDRSFPGYNLVVSAKPVGAELMDMRGEVIHRWQYPSASLPVDHRRKIDYWVCARILKNGDLLAMIPRGGILKIDKNSGFLWFRPIDCHHDFDIDGSGNIYTLTVNVLKSKKYSNISDESIAVLFPNGAIKKEISLYDLFKKYPDTTYIDQIDQLAQKDFTYTRSGNRLNFTIPGEVFHSNSIQVLDGKTAGNLLISLRNLGIIICVDPDKEQIVWVMETAFWDKGQHYAKLLDNGDIMVFDNYYHRDLSRVVEFDPVTQKIVWDYTDPKGHFFSSIAGQFYRLPNGNTLITESTSGHSFEVTADKKIVWEFYNPQRYRNLIAIIYQTQRIPVDTNLDWLKD